MDAVVSTLNSTTTPLSGGATFIGGWEAVQHYASVQVAINSDVIGSVAFQWSNVDSTPALINDDQYAFEVFDGQPFTLPRLAAYFRVVYTNDVVAQSEFRLQTILQYASPALRYKRVQDAISHEEQAMATKAACFARDPGTGRFYPVEMDEPSRSMNVNLQGLASVVAADGDIASIGATTDAEATGDGSLIGINKHIRTLLGGAGSLVPAAKTATNKSGTLTTGGTAQQLMASNASRTWWEITNPGTEVLWYSLTGTAAANGAGSKPVYPGGSAWPVEVVSTGAISWVAATTGAKITAEEYS